MSTHEYTHELGKRVEFFSGWYELDSEHLRDVDGRQVLYAVGTSHVDSSCCGTWGCKYALVLGYVRTYKCRKNGEGLWISEVELIEDERTRRKITAKLSEGEVIKVQFY